MKRKTEFYIVDWAGNEKFTDKTFKTFDAAWGFLMAKFHKDEDLGEFEVMARDIR